MSDAPDETKTAKEDFEKSSELFEPLERIKDFGKFWRTRQAVLSGEPLYKYPKKELDRRKLLGPWKFNIIQSSIAGLPSVFIIALYHFFKKLEGSEISGGYEPTEFIKALSVPFILMLTAYVVGRASFFEADSTKTTRTIASRLFLYLDAAYGLYPQLGVTTLYALIIIPSLFEHMGTVFYAFAIWQLIVSMKTIPHELFTSLGYTRTSQAVDSNSTITLFDNPGQTTKESLVSRQDPPIWKYRLAVLIVIPVISITTGGILLILDSMVIKPILKLFA